MRCRTIQKKLLAGEETLGAAELRHVRVCEACSRFAGDLEELRKASGKIAAPQLPSELRELVRRSALAQVRSGAADIRTKGSPPAALRTVLAAGAVAALGYGLYWMSGSQGHLLRFLGVFLMVQNFLALLLGPLLLIRVRRSRRIVPRPAVIN